MKPVLYSFRRCPYAIRARMALRYARIPLEHREILLRDKPQAMLAASPKGTVPVLVLPGIKVIDESIEVMRWALEHADPDHWWQEGFADAGNTLIRQNDFEFKAHLDHYKYADRYPAQSQSHYRTQAEVFLQELENSLQQQRYLLDDEIRFADVAIFPFIRQFAFVDKAWFEQAPYPKLQVWLQSFLDSVLFSEVMTKYPLWQEGNTNE